MHILKPSFWQKKIIAEPEKFNFGTTLGFLPETAPFGDSAGLANFILANKKLGGQLIQRLEADLKNFRTRYCNKGTDAVETPEKQLEREEIILKITNNAEKIRKLLILNFYTPSISQKQINLEEVYTSRVLYYQDDLSDLTDEEKQKYGQKAINKTITIKEVLDILFPSSINNSLLREDLSKIGITKNKAINWVHINGAAKTGKSFLQYEIYFKAGFRGQFVRQLSLSNPEILTAYYANPKQYIEELTEFIQVMNSFDHTPTLILDGLDVPLCITYIKDNITIIERRKAPFLKAIYNLQNNSNLKFKVITLGREQASAYELEEIVETSEAANDILKIELPDFKDVFAEALDKYFYAYYKNYNPVILRKKKV